MRTALVSDMHGNAVAFRAVLEDFERDPVDQVVCLGDTIQGGAQPAEVVALLRGLDCPVVLGNADAFVLDAEAGEEETTERLLAVREWTREQLGADGLAYVETFQPTVTTTLGGDRELLAFHGSPTSYDVQIHPHFDEEEFRRLLGPPTADVLTGGHIHLQYLRRYGPAIFVNPGSVGLSYDHVQPDDDYRYDSFAAYARIDVGDGGGIEIAFRRVPFERNEVAAAIEESGMPGAADFAAHWRREPAGRPRAG
jgi:predicted phosphodiesterase